MRGFFGIAIWKPKTTDNVGTLWRTAHALGAAYLAVIAGRYRRQPSDVWASTRHVPMFTYDTFDAFYANLPDACRLVAVEKCDGARDLVGYGHPDQAVYLLGPEDGSLSPTILARCHSRVIIPGDGCYNLAVAGALVMYDRTTKMTARRALASVA
jgi:tRNA(Leu) C34 or U34 (ribose-2'-O)-methylase TrmL